MGRGATATLERMAASLGQLEEVEPSFNRAVDLPHGNRSPPPPDQGGVSDRLGYRQPERGRGRRWNMRIGLPVAGADGVRSFDGSRIVRQSDPGGAPEPA